MRWRICKGTCWHVAHCNVTFWNRTFEVSCGRIGGCQKETTIGDRSFEKNVDRRTRRKSYHTPVEKEVDRGHFSRTKDNKISESILKQVFTTMFKQRSDYGTEYFEGNLQDMINQFDDTLKAFVWHVAFCAHHVFHFATLFQKLKVVKSRHHHCRFSLEKLSWFRGWQSLSTMSRVITLNKFMEWQIFRVPHFSFATFFTLPFFFYHLPHFFILPHLPFFLSLATFAPPTPQVRNAFFSFATFFTLLIFFYHLPRFSLCHVFHFATFSSLSRFQVCHVVVNVIFIIQLCFTFSIKK